MASLIKRLADRIGRRGSYLFFLALLDVLYGYSIWVSVGTPAIAAYDMFFSPQVWAVIWVGVGLVLAQQAFVRLDRVGFTLAVLIKFAWATIATYNFLYSPADPRGWISAVIWFAFGTLTAIVANWPEHRRPQVGAFNDGDHGRPYSSATGVDPD